MKLKVENDVFLFLRGAIVIIIAMAFIAAVRLVKVIRDPDLLLGAMARSLKNKTCRKIEVVD